MDGTAVVPPLEVWVDPSLCDYFLLSLTGKWPKWYISVMKNVQLMRSFCALPLLSATLCASGSVRVWDGGGNDDNFSTAANWAGDVAPSSGDCLVFMGRTRTSPYNDLDPESYSFTGIVFSNTTATCNAPFTLKGNRIRITGQNPGVVPGVATWAFGIWPMASTSTLTDVLELDVDLPNNSKMGCHNGSNHNLTFKGTVTGGNGSLTSMDQYAGILTFEGPVKNFTNVLRPNGNGTVKLLSSENEFSRSTTHAIRQGTLRVDSVAAFGGTSRGISLGQSGWDTPSTLSVNAGEDTRFEGPISVNGPKYTSIGGYLQNAVANTKMTVASTITAASSANSWYTDVSTGLGTTLAFSGVGDGLFNGRIASPNLWIRKEGTGTWTFSEESSCVSTGSLTVAAGQLVVNGDYSSLKSVSVSSGAILSGTGHVAAVTFAGGAGYRLVVDGTEFHSLEIDGPMTLNGSVPISFSASTTLVPNREYELLRFTSLEGPGHFSVGDGMPSSAILSVQGNRVTMVLATGELIWKGNPANNVWDATTPNWQDDMLFAEGVGVTFDDTAEEGTGEVSIPSAVQPLSVKIHSSRNYTFTGEGITGITGIDKPSGTSILTLANANTYTGTTVIDAGGLTLTGSLTGSRVAVGPNAVFTNTASGRISGNVSVSLQGSAFELDGSNDFTGGMTMTTPFTEKLSGMANVVRNPAALGVGDVSLTKGTLLFRGTSGALGRGRTLRLAKSGTALLYAGANTSFHWEGNTIIEGANQLLIRVDGRFTFGAADAETTFVAEKNAGINVRQNYQVIWNSRLNVGYYHQTDANVSTFNTPGNKWGYLNVQAGGIICGATNTLAVAPVNLGQTYESYAFYPYLDLNGHDQTISALVMKPMIEKSTSTVKSTSPAVLTVSNDVDTVTERYQGRIQGAVTLRKCGTGDWSFGCRNYSTGDVVVEQGTLTVTADDALPSTAETSSLVIRPGAKVVLSDGVNATVSRLTSGEGLELPAGVYGGEGCAVAGARIRPNLFGSGAGSLRVLHGAGGTVLLFR